MPSFRCWSVGSSHMEIPKNRHWLGFINECSIRSPNHRPWPNSRMHHFWCSINTYQCKRWLCEIVPVKCFWFKFRHWRKEYFFASRQKRAQYLISYFADPKIDVTVNTSVSTSYFTKRYLMNAMWSAFSTMLIQISEKRSLMGDEVFAVYETGFTLLT